MYHLVRKYKDRFCINKNIQMVLILTDIVQRRRVKNDSDYEYAASDLIRKTNPVRNRATGILAGGRG